MERTSLINELIADIRRWFARRDKFFVVYVCWGLAIIFFTFAFWKFLHSLDLI